MIGGTAGAPQADTQLAWWQFEEKSKEEQLRLGGKKVKKGKREKKVYVPPPFSNKYNQEPPTGELILSFPKKPKFLKSSDR